ncbi:MAG TPA: MFS transporter [Mycobacteriales bacterium]|nr:MFS transporter [Mycobacteriales bacterium]
MAGTESTGRRHERHVPDGVILALVCVAQFMVVLDVSIVNVALPSIKGDLHYSATGLQWVVNAYVLTFAGFLLLGGRIADLLGRRRVFIGGLAMFSVASLLGGLAQTSGELTAARAVQGLGGAVLSPATLTIIMTTFTEGEKRHRALGAWSAVAGAGGAFGVILGGVLTSYLSWRWVLYVNIPIGVAAGLAALTFLSESRRADAEHSLDVAGAILATGGLALLVYGIVGTDTHPWSSARTIGLLIGAVAILAVFLLTQARLARSPLMPLSLFRSRWVSAANLVMLLLGIAFFSMWYFLSLYLQEVHGYGPLKAGLLFLPMSASIIVGAQTSGRVIGRAGPRNLLVIGLAMSAGGFAWLTQLSATSGYVEGVLGGTVLISLGMGLSFTPLATAATTGVHYTQAGLASGVLNTSRQVGGSIGLAALATIATARFNHLVGTGSSQPVALSGGFDRAFLVAAVVCAVATLASFAIPRSDRPADERTSWEAEPAAAAVD